MSLNLVPCLTWVGKGIAKSVPDKLQLTTEELKSLIEERKINKVKSENEDISESEEIDEDSPEEDNVDKDSENEECGVDTKHSIASDKDDDDFESRYNLHSYDDDEDADKPFMNISDVATFVDNKEDKYITDFDAVEEDEKEEEEDFIIKDNDNLLLVGHIEGDGSVLEVHVFNEEEDSQYVHHDIVLPAYPLALEWLDFHPSDETAGNYVAVADMTPVIKIWDLDVIDILEPEYCLGEEYKKKKLKKTSKYHTDAVLSLSWNKHVRNILASGSADSSIIIWDLQEGEPVKKLLYHPNKVQSLAWHPFESSFLLSGCTDGHVKLYDCRVPDTERNSWKVEGEIEKVAWNLKDPLKFFCSSDQGFIYCIDMKNNKIEHSIQAHSDAVTGLDICPTNPNILVSASMDKTIKIWDLEKLKHVKTQKLKVGSINAAKFCPDSNMTIAIGGNNRSTSLKLIDLSKILKANEEIDSKPVKTEKSKKKFRGSSVAVQPAKKFKFNEKNLKTVGQNSKTSVHIKYKDTKSSSAVNIKKENSKAPVHEDANNSSPVKIKKGNSTSIGQNSKAPVHIKYED